MLLGGHVGRGGGGAYSALSMGSAILWGGTIAKNWVWRGDLGTMARTGAAMWLVAGAPVPSPSIVIGGSGVRESGLMSPIAVSCQVEADLTSCTLS